MYFLILKFTSSSYCLFTSFGTTEIEIILQFVFSRKFCSNLVPDSIKALDPLETYLLGKGMKYKWVSEKDLIQRSQI